MRHLAATIRALPMTFVVYVVEACLALMAVGPLAIELTEDARPSFRSSLGRVVWLETVDALAPAFRAQRTGAILSALLLLLLAPWLQMAWLQALAGPISVARALREAAALYGRAWSVSIVTLLLTAVVASPFVVTLLVVDDWVSNSSDARLHDLALLTAALPLVPIAWTALLLHDLARARSLAATAWSSVMGSLRAALSVRAQLPAIALIGLATGARAAGFWLGQRSEDPSSINAQLQLACFVALWLRSAWLACALHAGEPRDLMR